MPDPGPVRKWFGYNRKERRASVILLIIIAFLYLVRLIFPAGITGVEDLTSEVRSYASINVRQVTALPSEFDPNTASFDTLVKVGLPERQARTLISYRNKGGKFRSPSDIRKVYGVDDSQASRIIPYIKISKDTVRIFRGKQLITELNSSDSAGLEALPGIGPVLSARIIRYRNLLGGFASVSQLQEVYGLSPETYAFISPMLAADTSLIRKTNINAAGFRELSRFRCLENYEITAVLKFRELNGKIRSTEELVENKLISGDKAEKIRPYLKFN